MQSALHGEGFQIVPNDWSNRDCKRLAMMGMKSWDELKAQSPSQSPKQHLAAVRADRKARVQRQKPRLKKPVTY